MDKHAVIADLQSECLDLDRRNCALADRAKDREIIIGAILGMPPENVSHGQDAVDAALAEIARLRDALVESKAT